jgi:putative ABC transport system substrate-binding protein
VVLRDPNNAGKQLELAELKQAAHEMGIALEAVDARAINEVEGALSAIAAMGADALITLLDGVTLTSRFRIAEWAVKHRLPAIYQIKDFVTAGRIDVLRLELLPALPALSDLR